MGDSRKSIRSAGKEVGKHNKVFPLCRTFHGRLFHGSTEQHQIEEDHLSRQHTDTNEIRIEFQQICAATENGGVRQCK